LYLVLCEKRSAADTFSKVLGGKSGTYKGKKYKIVHASGHLFSIITPNETKKDLSKIMDKNYASTFKLWDIKQLPWDLSKFNWKLGPTPKSTDLFKNIKKELTKDVTAIILATDNDPSGEGSALGLFIIEKLNWKGKIYRVLHEDSQESIKKGWDKMFEIDFNYGQYLKAKARMKFDYGSMQLTVAATKFANKVKIVVNAGRLKSVILNWIGERWEEINNFIEKPEFEVRYKDENNNIYINKNIKKHPQREDVDNILNQFPKSPVRIDKQTQKKSGPPAFYDQSALCAVLTPKGIPAKETTDTYQKMYNDQILSYPRTADKLIHQEMFDELLPLVNNIAKVVGVDTKLLTNRKPRKTHVGDGGAHGANRPGLNVPASLNSLKKYGRAAPLIYEVVSKNFLACLGEDYEYNSINASTGPKYDFKGVINIPTKLGWKEIFTNELNEEEDETSIGPGKEASAFTAEVTKKPPRKPTEKWIVNQMAKYDLGTGSTRASAIVALTTVTKQLESKRGVLYMTPSGEIAYQMGKGTMISDPVITEKLFKMMEDIEHGKSTEQKALDAITKIVKHDMKVYQKNVSNVAHLSQYSTKEKHTFTDKKGNNVSFNKEWNGYKFSDTELEDLSKYKKISISGKDKYGKNFSCEGQLEEQEYKGKKFIGFKPDESTMQKDSSDDKITITVKDIGEISFKKQWSSHIFTNDEIKELSKGNEITFTAKTKGGKEKEFTGSLKQQKFKGKTYWGFMADFAKGYDKAKGIKKSITRH